MVISRRKNDRAAGADGLGGDIIMKNFANDLFISDRILHHADIVRMGTINGAFGIEANGIGR